MTYAKSTSFPGSSLFLREEPGNEVDAKSGLFWSQCFLPSLVIRKAQAGGGKSSLGLLWRNVKPMPTPQQVGNLSTLTKNSGSFLLELPFSRRMSTNIDFRRIF